MMRKGNKVKWTPEARSYLEKIKQALVDAPILISPDYSKEIFIFYFSSNDTLGVVLQKNSYGMEKPISYFSRVLIDVEVRYGIMEKQVYALVKYLKSFMMYALHLRIISYVPSRFVK
jgi:hypothetical protein